MAANSGETTLTKGSSTYNSIVTQASHWLTDEDRGRYCSVKVTNVFDNRYRVSFYRKHYPGENKVVPDFRISASFFCHYVDGVLYAKTNYKPSALND
jgi:hypothetical protein